MEVTSLSEFFAKKFSLYVKHVLGKYELCEEMTTMRYAPLVTNQVKVYGRWYYNKPAVATEGSVESALEVVEV